MRRWPRSWRILLDAIVPHEQLLELVGTQWTRFGRRPAEVIKVADATLQDEFSCRASDVSCEARCLTVSGCRNRETVSRLQRRMSRIRDEAESGPFSDALCETVSSTADLCACTIFSRTARAFCSATAASAAKPPITCFSIGRTPCAAGSSGRAPHRLIACVQKDGC